MRWTAVIMMFLGQRSCFFWDSGHALGQRSCFGDSGHVFGTAVMFRGQRSCFLDSGHVDSALVGGFVSTVEYMGFFCGVRTDIGMCSAISQHFSTSPGLSQQLDICVALSQHGNICPAHFQTLDPCPALSQHLDMCLAFSKNFMSSRHFSSGLIFAQSFPEA
jgi:hypothetical protein